MFENKKILILGMARSGYESAKLLARHNNTLTVVDMKEQEQEKITELNSLGVEVLIRKDAENLLDETFDYVIKNPGIKIDHPCVLKAEKLNIPVTNEVEVAYQFLPKDVKIVGITGSNGKTTTTTITYEFLKAAGKPVLLGGNIGLPVCALIEKVKSGDILVLEISGHQLHDVINFKTNVGIMTNLSEVHIDHFGTYENYKKNKTRLFEHHTNTDIAILNKDNKDVMEATKNIQSKKLYFSSTTEADAYIKDNSLYYFNEKVVSIDDVRIKGVHNLENIMCAILAVKEFNVSNETIKEVLNNFMGVEHRIEYAGKVNGREFYNDSKSTNVKSTQTALNAFKTPVILLLGGLDRNLPFDPLEPFLTHVTHIICYGETKYKIREFADRVKVDCVIVDTLSDAVRVAYDLSNEGDTVLLSPACASWDQYDNFEIRGKEFKKLVNELK